ncbi:heat shock 70 kDa protein 12B-like [Saccostrea cucullata]|uniref:heat shock 70 kDa protein 12B-like n=1 Tax=Saccostrea cuccullata TaxID=36930 RepID=UPI002ED43803
MYTKILNFIVGRIKRQANFAPGGAAAEEHTIEYVIATPTHWKGTQLLNDFEEALQKTKEIEHAKSKVIVTKAEMVSPFLHELKADVLCQNFNVDHLSFEENTKYAILDIGTTACELTILTSKKDAKDQAGEPIRTPWSKTVENLFLEMLDSMFGATVMNKFKTDKAGVLELLLSFEKIKTSKDIFKLNAKPEPLPMPCALLDQLSNELINTYLKAGNTIREKNSHISEEEKKDYFLCISPEQVQELFEPMLKIIEETIYKHFSNDQNSDIKCVCIIGGYANTKLVHKKARKCFPERTVVIPKEADIVVVQGAVYYGYKYINDKK